MLILRSLVYATAGTGVRSPEAYCAGPAAAALLVPGLFAGSSAAAGAPTAWALVLILSQLRVAW